MTPGMYFSVFFGLVFIIIAIITAWRRGDDLSNVLEDGYKQLGKQTLIVVLVLVVLAFLVLFIVNNFIIKSGSGVGQG